MQKALVGGQQAQIDFKVCGKRALIDKKRLPVEGQYQNSPESSPIFEE